MINLRGYVSSRNFMEERVPQHIQNIVIRDYCNKNNFQYLLSVVEYAMKNSFMMLNHAIENHDDEGIVAYSLFQMPYDNKERINTFNKILDKKKVIHFSVESMKITNQKDFEDIENVWLTKKTLKSCLTEF